MRGPEDYAYKAELPPHMNSMDVVTIQPPLQQFVVDDAAKQQQQGGVKFDQGKDPWHLAPWDAIGAIVKVLAFGAHKYAERNWEQGMDWSRPFSALMRHLTKWWNGESKDPETGYSHLWHAGCCILFLIAYEMRGIGRDDRPAQPTKNAA